MPLYEFDCPRCGRRFEELVPAGAVASCPDCGERETHRRFSPVSPPRRLGLGDRARRESDSRRAEREVKRYEGFAEDKRRRAERGPPGGG